MSCCRCDERLFARRLGWTLTFDAIAVAIQKYEEHGIEDGNLYVQLDQRCEAVDGFSEVYRLGVEVYLFDFGVGSHHGMHARERIREHSIGDQMRVLNVGIMARLRRSEDLMFD